MKENTKKVSAKKKMKKKKITTEVYCEVYRDKYKSKYKKHPEYNEAKRTLASYAMAKGMGE